MKKTLLLIVAALAVACEKPGKLSDAELKELVHQQNEKLEAAFKAGDMEQLARMYSPDAKLSANGENDIYRGRDAIKKFWEAAISGTEVVDMETNTLSIDASGDIIYETGKVVNKVKYQDSVYVSTAKYVNIWKKQPDGSYLLDVDTWNDVQQGQ